MHAVFYVISTHDEPGTNVPAHFHHACQIIAQYYRQGARVYVFTDSQEDAHQVDELLWQFSADSFIAHNLVGEGPAKGAPVEIGWQQGPNHRRQVLVNLATNAPDFVNSFQQIIDFVPADEYRKQQARGRYKAYRQRGIQLTTNQLL